MGGLLLAAVFLLIVKDSVFLDFLLSLYLGEAYLSDHSGPSSFVLPVIFNISLLSLSLVRCSSMSGMFFQYSLCISYLSA